MAKNSRASRSQRSAESLQDNVRRAGPAAGASYTLIGAIILLGGLGYGRPVAGHFALGLFVGLMLGMVVGFYELVKRSSGIDDAGRVDGRSQRGVLARRDR